jgi:hypothetical protein
VLPQTWIGKFVAKLSQASSVFLAAPRISAYGLHRTLTAIMSTLCKDARLKVERAKKHIADFTDSMIALENACTVTVEQDEEGRDSLTHELPNCREVLDNLSLIAGDAIHNLRTALDFAWFSTITRLLPDKVSDKTKFPVRKTRH